METSPTTETELEEMLELYRKIKESVSNKEKKHLDSESDSEDKFTMEEICLNLNIFTTWMKQVLDLDPDVIGKLYKNFSEKFDIEYRMGLYEIIADNFGTENISPQTKFYWSLLIIDLLSLSKSYKYKVTITKGKNITQEEDKLPIVSYDMDSCTTNLQMQVVKHMFECTVDSKERLCWFKENGSAYYVS